MMMARMYTRVHAVVSNYNPTTLEACADSALADINQLDNEMRARLQWSDVQMLRAILVFLDTQGWSLPVPPGPTNPEEGIAIPDDLAEVREAVELITSHFREPLEAKGVNLACIQDEVEEIVCFARKFLALARRTRRRSGTSSTHHQMQEASGRIFCEFASWFSVCRSPILMWRDCSPP